MRLPLLLALFLSASFALAQNALSYQQPPPSIMQLVDAPLAPTVLIDDRGEYMVLRTRDAYATIAELARDELRLAGLRIDPRTDIGSRERYYTGVSVKSLKTASAEPMTVTGLPAKPQLSNFAWSPDEKHIAMTRTTDDDVELWVLDVAKGAARRLHPGPLNANLPDVVNWLDDGTLLVKAVSSKREPLTARATFIPTGPTISANDGEKAQNRTYQDLLQTPADEHDFEQLARAEIVKVTLDGKASVWLPDAMYTGIEVSPDHSRVLVTTMARPFSYIVPYYRFPQTTMVYTAAAGLVATVMEVPLTEVLPKGFMATRTGRRSMGWRSDMPATLVFAEAMDQGDPDVQVDYRDGVYELIPPYNGAPKLLLKTKQRYSYTTWGDATTAVAHDSWYDTRNEKSYVFDPSAGEKSARVFEDRSSEDRYGDPGRMVTKRGPFGKTVLALDKGHVYRLGDGFGESGQFPFLTKVNLASGKTDTIYKSRYRNRVEDLMDYDVERKRLMVRMSSPTDFPNYAYRDLNKKGDAGVTALTNFPNPFASIAGIHKEVINYKRADGVDLSGTLYLPPGYDEKSGEKLPMILWAYPREYKDAGSAGQTTSNPNDFTYPYYGSPIYWVTRGYAVLDNAAFPIVGEGDAEPNDDFMEQLVANAKAAIDAVDERGFIDRKKVAVGGHSYGAFMVANLLTHSDLFAAGIARSGAYNRTLTPFGFQSEQRNYWEAPEVYNTMSPFQNARQDEDAAAADSWRGGQQLRHVPDAVGALLQRAERLGRYCKVGDATTRIPRLPRQGEHPAHALGAGPVDGEVGERGGGDVRLFLARSAQR